MSEKPKKTQRAIASKADVTNLASDIAKLIAAQEHEAQERTGIKKRLATKSSKR